MLRNSKKNITVSEHNSTLKFPKKGMQKTTFMMDKDKNAEAIKSPLRFVALSQNLCKQTSWCKNEVKRGGEQRI